MTSFRLSYRLFLVVFSSFLLWPFVFGRLPGSFRQAPGIFQSNWPLGEPTGGPAGPFIKHNKIQQMVESSDSCSGGSYSRFHGSISYEWRYSGGLPQCSNCGAPGEYACNGPRVIGNWSNTLTFYDEIPSGFVPIRLSWAFIGAYNCAGKPNGFSFISLNGESLGELTAPPGENNCACNECDGIFPGCYTNPQYMEFYHLGSNNIFDFELGQEACLNSLTMEVYYGLPIKVQDSNNQSLVIAYPTDPFGSNPGYLAFQDPLPNNPKLIVFSVQLDFYGNFQGIWTQNTLLPVMQGSSPNDFTAFCGFNENSTDFCGVLSARAIGSHHQNGWPGYNYTGINTIGTVCPGYNCDQMRLMIDWVMVTLTYYVLP